MTTHPGSALENDLEFQAAIQDAIDRILPALEQPGVADLRAALLGLSEERTVGEGPVSAPDRLRIATAVLERYGAESGVPPADAADLDAIRLVLEHARNFRAETGGVP